MPREDRQPEGQAQPGLRGDTVKRSLYTAWEALVEGAGYALAAIFLVWAIAQLLGGGS